MNFYVTISGKVSGGLHSAGVKRAFGAYGMTVIPSGGLELYDFTNLQRIFNLRGDLIFSPPNKFQFSFT